MANGLIPVIYRGPFVGETPDGTVHPGDELEVTPAQAAESTWFEPVGKTSRVKVTKEDEG